MKKKVEKIQPEVIKQDLEKYCKWVIDIELQKPLPTRSTMNEEIEDQKCERNVYYAKPQEELEASNVVLFPREKQGLTLYKIWWPLSN